MFKSIFLDASVLISILEEDYFLPAIVEVIEDYDQFFISSISYLFGYQKCRKNSLGVLEIHNLLEPFDVVSIDQETIVNARGICKDSDFEDALQVASCLQRGIEVFVTTDKKLFSRYSKLLNIKLL